MSLLLMAFYWVLFPYLLFISSKWLIKHPNNNLQKLFVVITAFSIFSWFLWKGVGENFLSDQKINDLCSKDGGIKVYEKVPLPSELVNKYGDIRIPSKDKATLADNYFYDSKDEYLRKDNPKLLRIHYMVIRRKDNKILGESIRYMRKGGGFYGPWSEPSYICPKIGPKEPQLYTSIFIKN